MERSSEGAKVACVRLADCSSAEEFRNEALGAISEGDITLDLDSVDYMDASSLQVLLAVNAEQRNRGRHLVFANASPAVLEWFEWTGAAQHLPIAEKRSGND